MIHNLSDWVGIVEGPQVTQWGQLPVGAKSVLRHNTAEQQDQGNLGPQASNFGLRCRLEAMMLSGAGEMM
jgi:hypothetical protein